MLETSRSWVWLPGYTNNTISMIYMHISNLRNVISHLTSHFSTASKKSTKTLNCLKTQTRAKLQRYRRSWKAVILSQTGPQGSSESVAASRARLFLAQRSIQIIVRVRWNTIITNLISALNCYICNGVGGRWIVAIYVHLRLWAKHERDALFFRRISKNGNNISNWLK